VEFTSLINSELTTAWEEKFAFMRTIPASNMQLAITAIENNSELLTLDLLIRKAVQPTSIPEETRARIFDSLRQEEEASWLKYRPIREIKVGVKNRLTVSTDDKERAFLEGLQVVNKDLCCPTAKETRKVFFL